MDEALPTRVSGRAALRFAAWGGLLATTLLSLGPEAESIAGSQPSDKLLHLAVYAPLALLFLVAEAGRSRPRAWIRTRLVVVGLILYGAALEGVQAFLPHRTGELTDLAANAAGVALGFTIWAFARSFRRRSP